MNARIGLLTALLGVQCLIIAAVLLADGAGGEPRPALLDFDPEAVDEIRISGGDDAVTVTRTDGVWRLPDGLPADGTRAAEVLDLLDAIDAPFPVATSAGARGRFEVAEDDHQRRVVLSADGETVVDLFLGTSPGYQQVHARRAGDDAVYAIGLSNYQVPAAPDQWLDKALLRARGEVAEVSLDGAWTLRRGDDGWLVDGEPADPEAVAALTRRLTELRVMGTSDRAVEGEPAAVVDVADAEGQYRLSLHGEDDGEPYLLRSSRQEGVFELAAYQAEQLLVARDELLAETGEQPDAGPPSESSDDG
ncbi:MAG: hypothetical protein CMD39_02060 [Gammaproteobacteria bacterium]|nr:hypothetical protein [Gammaproteobacteria bacterium]